MFFKYSKEKYFEAILGPENPLLLDAKNTNVHMHKYMFYFV